jgi:hypothetical protein
MHLQRSSSYCSSAWRFVMWCHISAHSATLTTGEHVMDVQGNPTNSKVCNHYIPKVLLLRFHDDTVNVFVLTFINVISKLFCQQMLSLLKRKMQQLTLTISLYMAPTCFGPFGLSLGSIRRNLAKVTVFVEIISKNTTLKLLLCSDNMCCVYWVLCGVWRVTHAAQHPVHTLQTEAHIATAQQQF